MGSEERVAGGVEDCLIAGRTSQRTKKDAGNCSVEEQPSSTTFLYDAFISYRHASPDDKIAETLHRTLEEYVVPRSLVRKGFPKKLSRVFRDREELPTSNSLTDGIRAALRQSRFLIVVCSRRTPGSRWIAKEIEIFQSLGRRGQILSLLVEGEPEESFPALLREARQSTTGQGGPASEVVEEISPLAADIRGGSAAESLRLLKNEKLRLLAPILGCSFDDLKQRHRQRFLRRVKIAVASILLGISAAAGAGSWYWDTHERLRTEYFANFVKQWGHAKGVGRLTADQVSHRQNSLKFYVRGERVEGFDVVNGYGEMTINNSVGTFIGETDTANDATRDFRYEWEYNTEGQVTKELAFDRAHRLAWAFVYSPENADVGHYADKNGYPRPRTGSGADYIQFTRNAAGFEIQTRFTDSRGDAEPNHEGVFGWSDVVDGNGLRLEEANVDSNGQLMVNRGGYARVTHRFNILGDVVEWRYFGLDGKPTYVKNGLAWQTATYDRYGRITSVQFWGKDDKPAYRKGGYCQVTFAYDDHGGEVEKVYRDAAGKPAAKPGDYARVTRSYDAHGRMIRVAYWEADNKPWKTEDAYSQMAYEYDAHGYQKAQIFLDGEGKEIAAKTGIAKETWTHDEQGNENELSLLGVDGKPVIGPRGYASVKIKYDSHSNPIEESYYGLQGEPVPSKGGYAKITSKYDDRGGKIEEAYWDMNGHPVSSTSGYARFTFVRNEHGQIAETIFYGHDGSPILIPEGFSKIIRKYDLRDNQTEAVCFGLNGKPRLNKKGFNRVTRTYNQFDSVVEESYWGIANEPVMTKDGYARRVFYYDEQGKKTGVEKFDAAGKSLGKESDSSD